MMTREADLFIGNEGEWSSTVKTNQIQVWKWVNCYISRYKAVKVCVYFFSTHFFYNYFHPSKRIADKQLNFKLIPKFDSSTTRLKRQNLCAIYAEWEKLNKFYWYVWWVEYYQQLSKEKNALHPAFVMDSLMAYEQF